MSKRALQLHKTTGRQLGEADTVTAAHDEIAALAYELWQQRGSPIGSPEEDWLRAQEELKHGRKAGAGVRIAAVAKSA